MAEMTTEQFKAAEARGRARLEEPRARSAHFDVERNRIVVQLTTGIELGFAPAAVEGLQNASAEDLKTIEIEGFGLGIHFPAVDADLYVPALLKGVLGSRRWLAAQPGPTMSKHQSSTMPSETTVAVFDTTTHAEAAIADLVAQGVPAGSIEHYAQSGGAQSGGTVTQGTTGTTALGATGTGARGLWAWLTGEDSNAQHGALYDKSIESGGVVVTVIGDTSQVDRIHAILETHDPIDLDERHAQYSAGGAYGTTADAAGMSVPMAGTGPAAGMTEALTLSEETLQVGRRAVDRGTTRVRKYVVERPVEEQIRLRDETVTVFRRPVTAGTPIGADAFTDRVITMSETDEEAVVAKTARVVEEVVVQKDVTERVETVRDTLRREEVEIGTPTTTGTTTTGTTTPAGARTKLPGV